MASDDWAKERAEAMDDKALRPIAKLICYQHCRASLCKDSEQCRTAYPGAGSGHFKLYIQEAATMVATALREAEQRGRQSILDRLKVPDEVLMEAAWRSASAYVGWRHNACAVCRALARTLEQEDGEMSLKQLLDRHLTRMAFQLVDSNIPTTREFWRNKIGYPEYAHDPRPLIECLTDPRETP